MVWAAAGLAVAWAQQVDVVCTPRVDAPIIDAAPLTIRCELDATAAVTWDSVRWYPGDGTVVDGDTLTHTYTTPGAYTLRADVARAAYVAVDTGAAPVDLSLGGFPITLCTPNEAEFRAIHDGGLEYRFINQSRFLIGCIDSVRWSVHAGESSAEPALFEDQLWETALELPEEGTYTVRLEVGGAGGAAGAELVLDARGGVPDALRGSPFYCSTGGAGGGALAALGLLLAGARRRR